MTLTRRGRIVAAIGATLATLVVAALTADFDAEAAPLPAVAMQQQATADKPAWTCGNGLARTIYDAGFRGESHRVAWAIAMRESNGNPRAISASDDWGLFQLNRPSWGGRSWWSDSAMLEGEYNARIAYKLSRGGKSWAMWGLDRYGNLDPTYYQSWGPDLWQAWIIEPFQRYYAKYPCATTPPKKGTK